MADLCVQVSTSVVVTGNEACVEDQEGVKAHETNICRPISRYIGADYRTRIHQRGSTHESGRGPGEARRTPNQPD
jgi:hypothetical protein